MNHPRHLKPAGEAIFKDRYTTKANELIRQVPFDSDISNLDSARFGLVGVPLSKPSISHSGASFAPGSIRNALKSYTTYSMEADLELTNHMLDFGDLYMDPTDIAGNQQRAVEGLSDVYATSKAENWFILGGDHSISYSSIKAFSEKNASVGVIQFDAHHDLRNTEDGGPTNGTPFRRLLDEGILEGENLVQIGIRDFTNAKNYHDYAKANHVTLYTMENVEKNTLAAILENEIIRLKEKVDTIYLSVDMDVLDQAFAPGCPAIGPEGMDSKTLLGGILLAAKHEAVCAMDIVEIDPTIDFRNMTSRVAAYLLLQFMKGKDIVS